MGLRLSRPTFQQRLDSEFDIAFRQLVNDPKSGCCPLRGLTPRLPDEKAARNQKSFVRIGVKNINAVESCYGVVGGYSINCRGVLIAESAS